MNDSDKVARGQVSSMADACGSVGIYCPAGACLLVEYWVSDGAGLMMLAEHGFTCYGTRQVLTQ